MILSKDILIKRYRSLLVLSAILVIISIFTLQFVNDYILIIQVLCIMVVWPLIVLKTNVNGLLDTNNWIHRSSIQDYKDFVTKVIEDSKKSSWIERQYFNITFWNFWSKNQYHQLIKFYIMIFEIRGFCTKFIFRG